jgi:pSer/pThr/pTyr-binding forkhead associated (FHA) protein
MIVYITATNPSGRVLAQLFVNSIGYFRPYIIDLESANGTFLNNQKIEGRRYYELKEKVQYF